jgi:hypothetical protein
MLKTFLRIFREIRKNKNVYESDKYYKDLNEIPLLNWWRCSKGELTYLWKKRENWTPYFFKDVFNDMYFQFDYIELDEMRKRTQANYYENKYLATKNIKWKRKADAKIADADLLVRKNGKETKLNDLIRFVQKVLNLSYYPDATKMSAGYFFNLYNEARSIVEKNGNN